MKRWFKRILLALFLLSGAALLVWAFIPKPVEVDVALVTRGPLQVSVDDEGKTRIRERYIVSAPLAGELQRITLDPGDPVEKGKTLLAVILPTDPVLLDPRARAEAQARVNAAKSRLEQAEPALAQAAAEKQIAEDEFKRIQGLFKREVASRKELDDATLVARARLEAWRAASVARDIARYELEVAEAALRETFPAESTRRIELFSPQDGRVLHVFQESRSVVTPGKELIEIGDPAELEVEVEALSTEAVKVSAGDPVLLERWGGAKPLNGVVRLVEPAAFTKISALGVEEQRVRIIIDLTDPPEMRRSLGHAFRVDARAIIWQREDALRVPTSALFRHDGQWHVYRVEAGRAVRRPVNIGHLAGLQAEVLDGLSENDQVIAHPSDKITPDIRIVPRISPGIEGP